MISITAKPITARAATARGTIEFSNRDVAKQIESMAIKKGDVLAIARVACIQAVKSTSQLIPLAHPIAITSVKCHLSVAEDHVDVEVTVESTGQTGVEMEALTGVTGSLLSIYDMCKGMDRNMTMRDIRVIRKTGGQSGDFQFA